MVPSSQPLLECRREVGLLIAVLDDDRRLQCQSFARSPVAANAPRARNHYRPFGDLERTAALRAVHALSHEVEHRCATRKDDARAEHGARTDDRPLVDTAVST